MKVRKVTTERQQQKLNVAAYARVSTLSEEQEESFDTQVEYYTAYIQSVDEWNFVDVYADQGKSGLSADKRPGFQRMIRDAMDGKIDKILVKSISRFGRNSLEAQTYVHKLKEKGVEVFFEREGISSFNPQADMVFNFLTAVAQEESRSTSQNLKWAFAKRAEQGIRHLGNNRVLGYDEIDGVLTPNEDAWAVKFMFESYASGMTMKQISEELQARGFRTLHGRDKLAIATIAGILRNEIYKGDRRIQKAPHNDMLTHQPEKGGEYKSYYVERDHEGIVSRELWEKVQQVLAEPRTVFENCKSHYLRGKVICANCGEVFMRTTRKKKSGKYKKWICKGHLASSGCKNQLMWEEDLLAHIEKQLGASDKETCEQIDKILIYPDGRVEIETK